MRIGILGATGSIGTQALNIIRKNPNDYELVLASCYENLELLNEIKTEFNPRFTFARHNIKELDDPSAYSECDLVINGISGIYGLLPSYAVLNSSAKLATANKESIVAAGKILTDLAKTKNKEIIPIDSEHSAVWQCYERDNVNKIILTASGGPFFGKSHKELSLVSKDEALRHPTWLMGKKVTIDSATLMNKGMEVLEAKWLFDFDNIDVVIHRQSLVHAIVEYKDGSSKMSVSSPDMRLNIQLAMTYPNRKACIEPLDFARVSSLKFEKPDYEVFECLGLAFEVLKKPQLGVVMQSTDEVAVKLFLEQKIRLTDIPKIINKALNRYNNIKADSIEEVLSIDKEIKEYTLKEGYRI